jgi:ATP-dependent protease HslVU (ClpYQ) peptidase subunit
MTCIVAQKTETGVLFGADATMTEGQRIFRRATSKLWNVEGSTRIVAAHAGAAMFGNVLRDETWPVSALLQDTVDAAGDRLAAFLRSILGAHTTKERGAWLIVAIDREIYYVDCETAVSRIDAEYCALGSGEEVALGALFAAEHLRHALPLDAHTKITLALNAACEHVTAHRPPYSFAETVAPGGKPTLVRAAR